MRNKDNKRNTSVRMHYGIYSKPTILLAWKIKEMWNHETNLPLSKDHEKPRGKVRTSVKHKCQDVRGKEEGLETNAENARLGLTASVKSAV
jgi:hypothetical protein